MTSRALIGLALILGVACSREPSDSASGQLRSTRATRAPAVDGFILRTGEGEFLQNGIVVKASPATGTESSIVVEQTFPIGGTTNLHLHEQGDELFYVVSGRGTATLGELTDGIGPGDVIFIPRNAVHRIENLTHDEPLRVVFFMDSPQLVEEFRAIHERVTSDPDRPITPEERAAISERVGGSRAVPSLFGQELPNADTGFAPIADGQLYYEVAGRGEPLVLVHGNAGDRRHWDHQFYALADSFKVIRYDVRGFGRSSLPREGRPYSDHEDLRQLLDHLGVSRAHVAGWSMGSSIAIDFVLAYPARALSLISVGPWINGYSSPSASAVFATLGQVASAISEGGVGSGADALMATQLFTATILDPSSGEEFHRIAKGYSWWPLLNVSPLQPLEPGAMERLESITVPTLILTAEHDMPACIEIADVLEERIAGAQKIVMRETGHLLHMEKPDEFNALVLDFLEGIAE